MKNNSDIVRNKVLLISNSFRYKIACGADQRFYGLLKTLLEEYDVTWIACETYGKPGPLQYYFMDNPRLETHAARMPRRTFRRRLLNKVAGWWYMVFGKMTYTSEMQVEALIKELNKHYMDQYSFVLLSYLAHTKLLSYLRTRIGEDVTIAIDTIDIQFQRYTKLFKARSWSYYWLRWWFLQRAERDEKKALALADCLIAIVPEEAKYFIENISHPRVFVCPTGLEVHVPVQVSKTKNKTILFVGAMSDMFNIQAVQYFKEHILPIIMQEMGSVRFIIVGSNPSPEIRSMADEHTVVTGYVDNTEEYYNIAQCLICPYKVAYSHRGRVIESLAHGVPVVVTPQAVQGMGLENVEGVFIKENDIDFAAKVVELLKSDTYQLTHYQSLIQWASDNYSYNATYGKLFKKIEALKETENSLLSNQD